MEYFTFIYLPILYVTAGNVLIFLLFLFVKRKIHERMVDKTSGIIKNDLIKTPPIELSEKEKRRYPKNLITRAYSSFFVTIVVSLIVFLCFKSSYLNTHYILFIGILTSLIFFVTFKASANFLSKRKLYRVKAYCYKVSNGRRRLYYMVYYDFISYSIECFPLTTMPSVYGLTVEAGSIVDILVVAGNKRLRPIDFIRRR